MTDRNGREGLRECPFCGGQAEVRETRLSPTMKGPGALVSVTVRHWCDRPAGLVGGSVEFRGRDHASAIAAWNRRPTETTSQGGGECS